MLKISFKDVGQGDSIVIEWKTKRKERIGIIDCNEPEYGVNPVIEHLAIKGYDKIEFIILSHPHSDHYSGLVNLLRFCESRNIEVKNFIHTTHSKKEFLLASVGKGPYQTMLADVFRTASRLTNTGLINYSWFLGGDIREQSFKGLNITFLSPTSKEFEKFDSSLHKPRNDGRINNPSANLLCTVIKISFSGKHILLTSDATGSTLRRILRKEGKQITSSELVLGQIPHHGSDKNHYKKIWEEQHYKHGTPAIISVGNNGYGHPARGVINSFVKMSYEIRSTNEIGGLLSLKPTVSVVSDLLDWSSEASGTPRLLTPNGKLNGTQVFKF